MFDANVVGEVVNGRAMTAATLQCCVRIMGNAGPLLAFENCSWYRRRWVVHEDVQERAESLTAVNN